MSAAMNSCLQLGWRSAKVRDPLCSITQIKLSSYHPTLEFTLAGHITAISAPEHVDHAVRCRSEAHCIAWGRLGAVDSKRCPCDICRVVAVKVVEKSYGGRGDLCESNVPKERPVS